MFSLGETFQKDKPTKLTAKQEIQFRADIKKFLEQMGFDFSEDDDGEYFEQFVGATQFDFYQICNDEFLFGGESNYYDIQEQVMDGYDIDISTFIPFREALKAKLIQENVKLWELSKTKTNS